MSIAHAVYILKESCRQITPTRGVHSLELCLCMQDLLEFQQNVRTSFWQMGNTLPWLSCVTRAGKEFKLYKLTLTSSTFPGWLRSVQFNPYGACHNSVPTTFSTDVPKPGGYFAGTDKRSTTLKLLKTVTILLYSAENCKKNWFRNKEVTCI